MSKKLKRFKLDKCSIAIIILLIGCLVQVLFFTEVFAQSASDFEKSTEAEEQESNKEDKSQSAIQRLEAAVKKFRAGGAFYFPVEPNGDHVIGADEFSPASVHQGGTQACKAGETSDGCDRITANRDKIGVFGENENKTFLCNNADVACPGGKGGRWAERYKEVKGLLTAYDASSISQIKLDLLKTAVGIAGATSEFWGKENVTLKTIVEGLPDEVIGKLKLESVSKFSAEKFSDEQEKFLIGILESLPNELAFLKELSKNAIMGQNHVNGVKNNLSGKKKRLEKEKSECDADISACSEEENTRIENELAEIGDPEAITAESLIPRQKALRNCDPETFDGDCTKNSINAAKAKLAILEAIAGFETFLGKYGETKEAFEANDAASAKGDTYFVWGKNAVKKLLEAKEEAISDWMNDYRVDVRNIGLSVQDKTFADLRSQLEYILTGESRGKNRRRFDYPRVVAYQSPDNPDGEPVLYCFNEKEWEFDADGKLVRTDREQDDTQDDVYVPCLGFKVRLEEQIKGTSLVLCSYQSVPLFYYDLNKPKDKWSAKTKGETNAREIVDAQGPCGQGSQFLAAYVRLVYQYVATVIGVLTVLALVVCGILMTIGGLSGSAMETAKTGMIAAIASLILLFSSGLLLRFVNYDFYGGGGYQIEGTEEEKQ